MVIGVAVVLGVGGRSDADLTKIADALSCLGLLLGLA
jgi:hypothetical protein